MATATDPRLDEVRDKFKEIVQPIIADVVWPMWDALNALRDAADELDDDAALGRRARAIVQEWASKRIERELARQAVAS